MSPTQSPAFSRCRSHAPALRLVHGQGRGAPEPLRGHDVDPPMLHVVDGPTHVLLAGANGERRAALLEDLAQTLSPSTVFEQADTVCSALEHAPGSRMAFIAGDLRDAPAESLMRMLAHRHPGLAVLIVDASAEDAGERVAARNDELRLQHA